MKAEINNENKAKFFALYWGQEIGLGLNQQIDTLTGKKWKAQSAFTECIELKSLSSISDEDAIELSRGSLGDNIDENTLIKHSKQFIIACLDVIGMSHDHADFLRSRGYAVPFLGLSVDELIAAGWANLTEI